jgi:hypothetical protein
MPFVAPACRRGVNRSDPAHVFRRRSPQIASALGGRSMTTADILEPGQSVPDGAALCQAVPGSAAPCLRAKGQLGLGPQVPLADWHACTERPGPARACTTHVSMEVAGDHRGPIQLAWSPVEMCFPMSNRLLIKSSFLPGEPGLHRPGFKALRHPVLQVPCLSQENTGTAALLTGRLRRPRLAAALSVHKKAVAPARAHTQIP